MVATVGAGAVAGVEDSGVVVLVSAGVAARPPEHAARSAAAPMDESLRIPQPKLGDIAASIESCGFVRQTRPIKVPVGGPPRPDHQP